MTPKLTKLSKTLSHALRHAPGEYGLKLDAEGWVNVDDLLRALADKGWPNVLKDHIDSIIQVPGKKRFQIVGERIRAMYGHSVDEQIQKVRQAPPDILYHGTKAEFIESICQKGLQPMQRQYVHLSIDEHNAIVVASRRKGRNKILIIKAASAYKSGINFYAEENGIWLSDAISPQFIEL
ncbi:MAG: RNA 2'-phosphotransferase [Chitinophagaceae bacterium]|nr:RNA 2'-phosphotransferase [Chitinophagaceae bacterium]MCB9046686.1 RNA 2'-phosphotransferase [Chitinophagales bacterium]